MRQCKECNKVKPWFRMYSIFMGLYTAEYDICKVCANKLRDRAVIDWNTR